MQRMLLARECGEQACGLEDVLHQRWAFLGADATRELSLTFMDEARFIDISTPTGELLLCGGGGIHSETGAFGAAIAIYRLASPREVPPHDPIVKLSGTQVCPHAAAAARWMPHDPALFVLGGARTEFSVWDSAQFTAVQRMNIGKEEGVVTALDMSSAPGAQTGLVAVADDQSQHVKLVDLASGAFAHRLEGHSGYVRDVRWSPANPNMLVSAAKDGVRLFDVRRSGKTACLLKFNEFRKMPDIAWDLDILGRRDTSDEVCRPRSKRRTTNATAAHASRLCQMATSPLLGLGCAWTTVSPQRQRRRRNLPVLSSIPSAIDSSKCPTTVRFSPDGATIVNASKLGEYQIFDVFTGRLIGAHSDGASTGRLGPVFAIARDNYHLLADRAGQLYAIGLDTGEYLWERIGQMGNTMSDIEIHPVNEEVYSVSGTTVHCWSADTGQL